MGPFRRLQPQDLSVKHTKDLLCQEGAQGVRATRRKRGRLGEGQQAIGGGEPAEGELLCICVTAGSSDIKRRARRLHQPGQQQLHGPSQFGVRIDLRA